jgi:dihydrofolate reductase
MGKVFIDMAMSLDGFVAGPNNEDAGLHDWYFAPEGSAPAVIDELLQSIGAMVLGRRAFGEQPEGFETPYKVPHFVLTHAERPSVTNSGVTFSFIPTVERILTEAQAAAGGRAVCIAGGARTAREFLSAGLVDEIQLHLVSKLLGDGLRLFDQLPPLALERTRVLESPGVTHLQFRVLES